MAQKPRSNVAFGRRDEIDSAADVTSKARMFRSPMAAAFDAIVVLPLHHRFPHRYWSSSKTTGG